MIVKRKSSGESTGDSNFVPRVLAAIGAALAFLVSIALWIAIGTHSALNAQFPNHGYVEFLIIDWLALAAFGFLCVFLALFSAGLVWRK